MSYINGGVIGIHINTSMATLLASYVSMERIDKGIIKFSEEPVKFALVGLSGVGVNYFVLFICITLIGLGDPLSLALGIIISMSTNYLLNRWWTFKSHNPIVREYFKYLLSNSVGALSQFGVALFIETLFEQNSIYSIELVLEIPTIYFASGIGILIGFIINFLLSKYFVFTKSQ